MKSHLARLVLVVLFSRLLVLAQEPASNSTSASASSVSGVPRLIRFSGVVKDPELKPFTTLGITFLLYKDQQGGAPSWMETQNVQPDANGHYTVQLGSTQANGMPVDLFSTGEARWLGVQVQGQAEQPRVLLLSVPYALKAADAETLGGKPLSAFQLALPQAKNSTNASTGNGQHAQAAAEQLNEINCTGTTGCKAGFIPRFSTNGGSATVSNSLISQSGTNINVAGSLNTTNVNASGTIAVNNGSSLNPILSQATAANAAAIVGYSKGPGLTDGVMGSTLSSAQGTSGVIGLDLNSNGISGKYTAGVTGFTENPFGVGVLGYGVFSNNGKSDIGFYRAGVWGDDVAGAGLVGTSDTGYGLVTVNTSATKATLLAQNNSTGNAVLAVNTSTDHPTLFAQNNGDGNAAMAYNTSTTGTTLIAQNNTTASNGLIFQAKDPNVKSNGSPAACQINTRGDMGCTGDVVQTRPANGLVKALVYVDPSQPAGQQIVRCYNSLLSEPDASTPPCGFRNDHLGNGDNRIEFGFTVNDRFAQVTAVLDNRSLYSIVANINNADGAGPTQLEVDTEDINGSIGDRPFYLTVF